MPSRVEVFNDVISAVLGAPAKEPIATAVLVANAFVIWSLRGAAKQFRRSKKTLQETDDLLADTRDALHAFRDRSCVWKTSEEFFLSIRRTIERLKPQLSPPTLHIYRGYDQGDAEQNNDLRDTIKQALLKKTISEFHRVVVVTNKHSIPITVRWMQPFAAEQVARRTCHFYISFRRKFNLGSYVALGKDDCFLAMPRTLYDDNIRGPAQTHSGVFVSDEEIANIIRNYIERLHDIAHEPSVHVIPCPLSLFGPHGVDSRKAEEYITEAFNKFSDLDPRGS